MIQLLHMGVAQEREAALHDSVVLDKVEFFSGQLDPEGEFITEEAHKTRLFRYQVAHDEHLDMMVGEGPGQEGDADLVE